MTEPRQIADRIIDALLERYVAVVPMAERERLAGEIEAALNEQREQLARRCQDNRVLGGIMGRADPDDNITDEMFATAREIVLRYIPGVDEVKLVCIAIEFGRALLKAKEAGRAEQRERCAQLIEARQEARRHGPTSNWEELDATAIRQDTGRG